MSTLIKNGIRLTSTGADSLPLSVASNMSPEYDGERCLFTITVKNETDSDISMPYDEISGSTVLIYRNLSDGEEIINNHISPPKEKGIIDELSPNEEKSYNINFDYPHSLAKFEDKVAIIQFCMKWDASWLRLSSYDLDEIEWNESFELCHEIKIIDD